MGVFCGVCERIIPGDINAYKQHLLKRKDHVEPFTCHQDDCKGRTFQERTSLYRHLKAKHPCLSVEVEDVEDRHQNVVFEGLNTFDAEDDDSGADQRSDNDDNDEEFVLNEDPPVQPRVVQTDFKKAVAYMLLNLRRKGNITSVAITQMLEETEKLFHTLFKIVKEEISGKLRDAGVDDLIITRCVSNVSVEKLATGLKSKKEQMAYFQKHFGLVAPEEIFIGHRSDNQIDPETNETVQIQVPKKIVYVKMSETLTAVLNNPVLFELIQSEKASTDGFIRSYLDGNWVKGHELIKKHPQILRIVIYLDEYEPVSPLGSKTKIHKILAVYFIIQNLPAEENARLRSVHVLAYAYSEDIAPGSEGSDVILTHLYKELEELESEEGVQITVNNEPYTLRATVVGVAADSLGAHEVCGLLPPQASCFCRYCVVSRKQFHQNIFARGEDRTAELHLQHLQIVNERGKKGQTLTGVLRDCLLRKKHPDTFPKIAAFDGMHDILKGVAAMEIKLALHEFCIKKKYISVDLLNARLASFSYGRQDAKNKPSPTFTEENLRKLGSYGISQTASQTWCLLRVLPFIVTPEVPLDDHHLKLLSLLKRISDIVFSSAVSERDLENLQSLLIEHHTLFATLYPASDQDVGHNSTREEEEAVDDPENETEVEMMDVDDIEEDQEITDDEEIDVPENEEGVETGEDEQTGAAKASKKKKKKKKVRAINKHHYLMHYTEMIRNMGAAVLYWCMRFEAKHLIGKRYSEICCNFLNIILSVADIHQMNHCAEILEIEKSVKNELSASKMSVLKTASETPYHEALSTLGISDDDVLSDVKMAKLGGFEFRRKFYVMLPIVKNDMPVFGQISELFIQGDDKVVLVVKHFTTVCYDCIFGAFRVEANDRNAVTALYASSVLDQPLSSWRRYGYPELIYLSPRRSFADIFFDPVEVSEN